MMRHLEQTPSTTTKLLIQGVTLDESSSDIATGPPSARKGDMDTDQQSFKPELSDGKGSNPSKEGSGHLDPRTTAPVQTNGRHVQQQLKDESPRKSDSDTVKLKEHQNYTVTGKDVKEKEGTLGNKGLNELRSSEEVSSKEDRGDTKKNLNDDAGHDLVQRNGKRICLEINDGKPDTVVDLRRSKTGKDSTLPGNIENLRTPITGADRRGVVIQNSAIVIHSEDYGTLDPNLLDNRIQQTKKVCESLVKTANYTKAEKMLNRRGYLTLSGAPGEGKTSLALMLGVLYQQKGYDLVFVNDVAKFKLENHVGHGRKVIFIFDDIFGTVGLSSDVPQLRSTFRDLHHYLRNIVPQKEQKTVSNLLAIFTTNTCNLQIGTSKLGWENLVFFNDATVIELNEQKTFRYSFDGRKTVFQKLKSLYNCSEVDFEEITNCGQTAIGFPLTCQLFFQYKPFQNNPKEFFKKPLIHLTKEFEKFLEQRNENAAALVFMLLCNGKIDLMQLEKGFSYSPFGILFNSLKSLMPQITEKDTIRAVKDLQGLFFTEGDVVGFCHPIICDAFACVLYKTDPQFVIEYCSLQFLYERFRTAKCASQSSCHHFIYITDAYHDIIANRLAQAVREGRYSVAITNPVLKKEQIVDRIFDLLDVQKTNASFQENEKPLLYWALHSNSLYLVQKLLALGLNLSDAEISVAFEECAFSGNLDVMTFLMTKFKAIKQYNIRRALTTASENNYSKMVKYLLRYCQDIIPSQQERNLLMIALENRNPNMEKDIISAICRQRRIPFSCKETNHLLHVACMTCDVTLANYVIPAVDINKPFEGFTPVMTAAVLGQKELFDLLVSKGAYLRLTDQRCDNMLHLAIVGGNIDIVKRLLPLFDINVRGQDGMTPLMKASVAGQNDVFDLLVSKKADLRLTDNYGNNILHSASCGNSTYIVGKILPLFDINVRGHVGWTAVMRAAYNGQEEVFDLLVSKGADLTLTDNLGANVLHWACCSSSTHIVEQLLPFLDKNLRSYKGFTALMHSASHGQSGVFKLLLSKEADLTVNDSHGNNLLHWACCSSSTDIVNHLLPKFDINVRGQNGSTPVMNAACYGQRDVFHLLVSEGADLKLTNDFGSNLLYLASLGGNVDIVEHVLALFDINSMGRNGMTPLMVAANEGHEEVFALLVKNGADLMLTDADDHNLLHLAQRGGCESIMEFLSTSHM